MTEAGEPNVRFRPRALIRVLLGALVFIAVTPAVSQTPQFEEFHTWTDFATVYNSSERFRYDGGNGGTIWPVIFAGATESTIDRRIEELIHYRRLSDSH